MSARPQKQIRRPNSGLGGALRRYDNCTFAVFVKSGQTSHPLRGNACYQRDDLLGNILRISLAGGLPGRPDIIVAEDEWNGLIISGREHRCDYCLFLIPEEN